MIVAVALFPLLSVTVTLNKYVPNPLLSWIVGVAEVALAMLARSFNEVHTKVSGLFPAGLFEPDASTMIVGKYVVMLFPPEILIVGADGPPPPPPVVEFSPTTTVAVAVCPPEPVAVQV